MKIKTILAIILFVVSLMSIITSVSALVVEINSQPTDTNFTIGQGNSTGNETSLILNLISPVSKTYINKDILIKFETNKPAYCSYIIDNNLQVNLGLISSFSKTINFLNGEHNLNVKCTLGDESVSKQITFKVDKKSTSTNSSSLESDNLYEEQLRYPVYDEWICVNNKLQRSVVQYNLENIEYGQPCGYVLESTDKNVPIKDIFWYLAIIVLVILILMAIVLIAMFLLGSR